jgi:sigma-B regulation protein RsbU (phosphoserine phosphatase)
MNSNNRLSILVVDDNPVNVKMLETCLAKEGYRVITALDGPSAREIVLREHPDLILLDIQMPEENGFDVIRSLKSKAATASIPVLFITGVSEIKAKLEGFELGAVDYITKPFETQEVIARVGLHLKLSIATNSLITSQAEKLKQITEAQVSLLTTPDQHPNANFGVHYIALQEAGGDFYEVLPITEEIYGYFIADFSGHDISTSYLTTSVKALLKQNCSPIYHPLESMKMINDVLVEILPAGKYLTANYVLLNRRKNQVTIISAGHPPVCYVPVDGAPELIELKGDVIGIFKDVLFGSKVIKVQKGDRLFLYTDGIIESLGQKIVWTEGAEKILTSCDAVRNVPIRQAPEAIFHHIRKGESPLEDDIVIVGFEI